MGSRPKDEDGCILPFDVVASEWLRSNVKKVVENEVVFATVVIGKGQLPILSNGECGPKVAQSGGWISNGQ
jgi:hypothetical protein